jgi:hypothetical protein
VGRTFRSRVHNPRHPATHSSRVQIGWIHLRTAHRICDHEFYLLPGFEPTKLGELPFSELSCRSRTSTSSAIRAIRREPTSSSPAPAPWAFVGGSHADCPKAPSLDRGPTAVPTSRERSRKQNSVHRAKISLAKVARRIRRVSVEISRWSVHGGTNHGATNTHAWEGTPLPNATYTAVLAHIDGKIAIPKANWLGQSTIPSLDEIETPAA